MGIKMKKICSILLVVFMIGVLSGCAQKYPEDSTVYIQKKGQVLEATIESFDKDYYNQEELETFIRSEIEEFEGEEGSVKLKSFTVEESIAKLMLEFKDYKAYADFNGRELFTGTVVQAIAAGYIFDVDFVAANNNNKSSSKADSTETMAAAADYVSSTEVTDNDDYKVVILNENTNVVVKGKICYVSAKGVTVTANDTAKVSALDDEVSYIVYK